MLKAVALPFENLETQKTRTLAIIYKGHLIHENYVEGFDKDTPVLGWSMTKSILATCFGVLENQGKIQQAIAKVDLILKSELTADQKEYYLKYKQDLNNKLASF